MHLLVFLEDRFVSADPQSEFAAGVARGAATRRRVEHMGLPLGEGGMTALHHRERIGREVE